MNQMLVILILIFAGGGVLFAAQNKILTSVDENYHETICKISLAEANAKALQGGQFLAKPKCKTQNKDIPLKEKKADANVVKKDIAELMSKCWDMHLEGALSKNALDWSWWGNNCNVCYMFTITDLENSDYLPVVDQLQFLMDEVKEINSNTDDCFNGGGFCIGGDKFESKEDCKEPFEWIKENGKCNARKGCCYSRNSNCLNNGGKCVGLAESCGTDFAEYSKYGCEGDTKCCVSKENHFTYVDYIQNSKGPGKIAFDGIMESFVEDEQVYAISYVANTDSMNTVATSGLAGGTILGIIGGVKLGSLAAGTAGAILTVGSGGTIPLVVGVTTFVGVAISTVIGIAKGGQTLTDYSEDMSYIYVSPYERVQNTCNIQN